MEGGEKTKIELFREFGHDYQIAEIRMYLCMYDSYSMRITLKLRPTKEVVYSLRNQNTKSVPKIN